MRRKYFQFRFDRAWIESGLNMIVFLTGSFVCFV